MSARETNPLFEAKPRWPGAPKICLHANLPAFETEKGLAEFLSDTPRVKVRRKWKCTVCQCWHADTIAPDPAGDSSGTGRGAKQL